MINNNITIYIGDIKVNLDSHMFVEEFDETSLGNSFDFDSRILFFDADYLNLNKKQIQWIVKNCTRKALICTLYPEKIHNGIECQIVHKEGWIDDSGENLYDIVRACFHQKDRKKLRELLLNSNISTHFLNKWLHCNPTGTNFDALKILDYYTINRNPDIWIDLVSILINDGPDYPAYKYKRHNE